MFSRTAKKKKRTDKIAQRSFILVQEKDEVYDSNDDPSPEFGLVADVKKPQKKHASLQSFNALMREMKHNDLDRIRLYNEDEVPGYCRESLDEVETRL
jgi:hypothetical protein